MSKRANLILGAAILAAMSAGLAPSASAAQEQAASSVQSAQTPYRCFLRDNQRYCYQPPSGPIYRDPSYPPHRTPPPKASPPPLPPPPPIMHAPYCPGCNGRTSDTPPDGL